MVSRGKHRKHWSWDDVAYGKGTFVTITSNISKYVLIKLNHYVNGIQFLISDKFNQ